MDIQSEIDSSASQQRRHLESFVSPGKVQEEGFLDSACIRPILEVIVPAYAVLDAKAKRWQKWFLRSTVAVYLLAAVAVSVAIVQHIYFVEKHLLVMGEVVALLVALALIRNLRRRRWRERWLHARHLAEHLRTAMFLVPLQEEQGDVGFGSAGHLPFYESPISVLQEKVRATLEDASLLGCRSDDLKAVKRFLVDGWVRNQVGYHRVNARQKEKWSRLLHGMVIGLFILTLIAAVEHVFMFTRNDAIADLCVFMSIGLPAIATALHGIGEGLEFERMAHRSTMMAGLLEELATRLDEAESLVDMRTIADEVQRLLGSESHEWLVSISARPEGPVVPT